MFQSKKVVKATVYLLATIFLLSGVAKLASLDFEIKAFEKWGYPLWLMYLGGFIEISGGLGLLIPQLSALAGLSLAGFMMRAVATHAAHAEWPMLILASSIMIACAYLGWSGRKEVKLLLSRLKLI